MKKNEARGCGKAVKVKNNITKDKKVMICL